MDLQVLKARINAAREKWVTLGARQFLVRRPTELDVQRLAARGLGGRQVNLEMVLESVRDWRGVTVADLLDGEDAAELTAEQRAELVPFDREAFEFYIADRSVEVGEIAGAIGELMEARAAREKEKKT